MSLTILNLNQGDSQEDIVDKVNSNFDSIVANGGGPQGQKGDTGDQGAVGAPGPKGDPGQEGTRGTKWYVQSTQPTGGTSTPLLIGDYWVDTINSNKIYVYGNSGWTDTGFNLQSTEVFEIVQGISGPAGNKNAVVFNTPSPELNTLVLSDSTLTTSTANPTYSKLLISTNSTSDYPLVEFAKTNASGVGTPADYNRHPQFRWYEPASSNYNLLFSVPQDSLTIKAGGSLTLSSTASSLSISGNNGVSVTSGSSLSISSSSTMNFSSGSSVMTFTSQKFNLNASGFSLSVPLTLSSTTSAYALTLTNTGSGGVLSFSSSSSSTSYFLANFLSSGTARFQVRNDGRVRFSRSISGLSFLTSSTYNSQNYIGFWCDMWWLNTSRINNGNTISVNLTTTGGSYYRGVSLVVGNSETTSFTQLLEDYDSITLRVFASDLKPIRVIAIQTSLGGSFPSTYVDLGVSGAYLVEFTIIRLASSSSYKVYYSACNGSCGYLI